MDSTENKSLPSPHGDIGIRYVCCPKTMLALLNTPCYHIVYIKKGDVTIRMDKSVLSLVPKSIGLIEGAVKAVDADDDTILTCYVISIPPQLFEKEIQSRFSKSPVAPVSSGECLKEFTPLDSRILSLLCKGLFILDRATSNTSGFVSGVVFLIAEQFRQHYVKWYRDEFVFKSIKHQIAFRFIDLVQLQCNENHSVRYYAERLCITRGHLTKIMKETGNKTPKQCIREALVSRSIELLQIHSHSITAISEMLGFSSPASFSTTFRKQTGVSPSDYRNSHIKT